MGHWDCESFFFKKERKTLQFQVTLVTLSGLHYALALWTKHNKSHGSIPEHWLWLYILMKGNYLETQSLNMM